MFGSLCVDYQFVKKQRHKTWIALDIKAKGVQYENHHSHKATTQRFTVEQVMTRPERKTQVFNYLDLLKCISVKSNVT